MKKKTILFLVILSVLLLVTGCDKKESSGGGLFSSTKTLNCHKEEMDEDGYKTTDSIVVTYNSKKVLKVKNTNIMETDPAYIDFSLAIGNGLAKALNQVKGIKMVYEKIENNKIKFVLEVDYEKIDLEEIKKALGDLYSEDDNLYTAKDFTIDDFRGKNLQGYTCE